MSDKPNENGTKIDIIKQKFERKISRDSNNNDDDNIDDDDEQKEQLRRSLSASPVKRNLKLNVTRQFSSPASKNIKRTPAFRGDKLIRTKNLNSPIKEKITSIVDHNVKIFEEKPEYGKIGNVKKKNTIDEDIKNNNLRLLTNNKKKFNESTVRTTVISRQKNISPMYTNLDDDFVPTILTTNDNENLMIDESNKLQMNDNEYMKIKNTKDDNNNEKLIDNIIKNYRIDNLNDLSEKKIENKDTRLELTDSLKAALKAPLPTGPAPKKPPRTFAHSPLTRKYQSNNYDDDNNQRSSWLHEEFNKKISIDVPDFSTRPNYHKNIKENNGYYIDASTSTDDKHDKKLITPNINDLKPNISSLNSIINKFPNDNNEKTSTSNKLRSTKDSRKMLEKLETVLFQHQQAIGSKVIIPSNNKIIEVETRKKSQCRSENDLEKRVGKIFFNHLSNTLEEQNKHVSLNKNHDLKIRKQSIFNCPYLNCASETVYEQPSFKNYLTDSRSISETSLSDSISNILSSNNDLYDELLSPASKRLSTELTTFSDVKRRQSDTKINDERVYAEPFTFDKNCGTDITSYSELSPEEHNYLSRTWRGGNKHEEQFDEINSLGQKNKELHYMCTPISSTVHKYNNNPPENIDKTSRDKISFQSYIEKTNSSNQPLLNGLDKIKAEDILNQAFGQFVMAGSETSVSTDSNASSDTDSLASTKSIGDESTSLIDKRRLFKSREMNKKLSKEEIHRSLTEKRKNYVRNVSMKYSETYVPSIRERKDQLFDVCLLVALNLSDKKPYIKDKYPINATAPSRIELFCFPDAQKWPSSDSTNSSQFYSLSLMDEKGNRRHGYCYRVRPEGGPIFPLAYCLVTKHRASGFYHKILLELESRHGLPNKERRYFMEKLYNSTIPKPGDNLKIIGDKLSRQTICNNNDRDEVDDVVDDINNNHDNNDNIECIIMRSSDPRLESRDMSSLFDTVSDKILIYLFGCLLLERRVILMSDNLSKLSSCIEALQSLLYPFNWPHTFIPVLPDTPELSPIIQAPLPFVIGILKKNSYLNSDVESIDDGIVVDLDTNKIICMVGDESSILPSKLQKGIKTALHWVKTKTKYGDGFRNFLVSEAFLRIFVETCAHLEGHLVAQQDGKVIFQKESFIKASNSKGIQYFLEWFVETTMFHEFVNDFIGWIEGSTVRENNDIKLFVQRIAEYQKKNDTNLQKKYSKKKKNFGDRLKDLTNFYTQMG
ncbi:hypothetical protein HCN44_004464 [Aphidius gifuensis]|uniref:UDENN domain-containing protein n=1 Tax=Aphidius gifuensis TaxID=684658 RepID=A0A834XZ47_APHGI|nr:uncharacterized protein PFB0145c-like [Aphidius gifuensis]KAF7994992.1 hypothetical protein HCN44_004464 [Aphidius gifuensis]